MSRKFTRSIIGPFKRALMRPIIAVAAVVAGWILATGTWDDDAVWNDAETWKDS